MLELVLNRLAGSSTRSMPVMQDGQLVGLVTLENLGEYLMVQNALHRRRARIPAAPAPRA
jgi:hypothetical protein